MTHSRVYGSNIVFQIARKHGKVHALWVLHQNKADVIASVIAV